MEIENEVIERVDGEIIEPETEDDNGLALALELKQYILTHYKRIRQFSIANNIPYSTIDNLFTRGLYGSAVSTIMKICDALDIDIDQLLKGRIMAKSQVPTAPFSERELKLLSSYRNNPQMQDAVDKLLNI